MNQTAPMMDVEIPSCIGPWVRVLYRDESGDDQVCVGVLRPRAMLPPMVEADPLTLVVQVGPYDVVCVDPDRRIGLDFPDDSHRPDWSKHPRLLGEVSDD
ncbi:MAG: hypothetical protein WCI47_01025 [bacterium]